MEAEISAMYLKLYNDPDGAETMTSSGDHHGHRDLQELGESHQRHY